MTLANVDSNPDTTLSADNIYIDNNEGIISDINLNDGNHDNNRKLLSGKPRDPDLIICTFVHVNTSQIVKTMTVNPKNGEYCYLKESEGLRKGDLYITKIRSTVFGRAMIVSEVDTTLSPTKAPIPGITNEPTSEPTMAPTGVNGTHTVTCVFKHDQTDVVLKTMTIVPSAGERCIFDKTDGLMRGEDYVVEISSNDMSNVLIYTEEEPMNDPYTPATYNFSM